MAVQLFFRGVLLLVVFSRDVVSWVVASRICSKQHAVFLYSSHKVFLHVFC